MLENWKIANTPFAFIDTETTGFNPSWDRVLEVSIVVIDPGECPRIAFDSLLNPQVSFPENVPHRIHNHDVVNAPLFQTVAADIVQALAGYVCVGHNFGRFDFDFLKMEFSSVGVEFDPPYIDTLVLERLYGEGGKCNLDTLRERYGIPTQGNHSAANDAMACALVFQHQIKRACELGMTTIGELVNDSAAKMAIDRPALTLGICSHLPHSNGYRVSRAAIAERSSSTAKRSVDYAEELMLAMSDLLITETERAKLHSVLQTQGLSVEQRNAFHSCYFSCALAMMASDGVLSVDEMQRLNQIWNCLAYIGWAPGQVTV